MSPLGNCGIPVFRVTIGIGIGSDIEMLYRTYEQGIMKDISAKPRSTPINCNSSVIAPGIGLRLIQA
jgi:hypothetical protein